MPLLRFDFIKQGFKNIKEVGTFTRTSKIVSKRMIAEADIEHSKIIVELGAGDGAITKYILEQMGDQARLFVFEVNPYFCEKLKLINDSRIILIQDSAEHIVSHLAKHNITQVDAIISAIPFVVLPEQASNDIINKCKNILKPGRNYVQIHYSTILKKLYERIFGNVSVKFVPMNIPPAFVLVSKKNG